MFSGARLHLCCFPLRLSGSWSARKRSFFVCRRFTSYKCSVEVAKRAARSRSYGACRRIDRPRRRRSLRRTRSWKDIRHVLLRARRGAKRRGDIGIGAAVRIRACRTSGPLRSQMDMLITLHRMGAGSGIAHTMKFSVHWRWSITKTSDCHEENSRIDGIEQFARGENCRLDASA